MVNRRDAVNEVMEHTSTSVNYHKIVLSPSEEEPVHDWREWTRQVMHDLEEAQGKELHWFAVHHNTEHPHVHVVVAGAGYNQEKDREEPVKLYTKDYDLLRESGREYSDYHFRRAGRIDHWTSFSVSSLFRVRADRPPHQPSLQPARTCSTAWTTPKPLRTV